MAIVEPGLNLHVRLVPKDVREERDTAEYAVLMITEKGADIPTTIEILPKGLPGRKVMRTIITLPVKTEKCTLDDVKK